MHCTPHTALQQEKEKNTPAHYIPNLTGDDAAEVPGAEGGEEPDGERDGADGSEEVADVVLHHVSRVLEHLSRYYR